MPRKGLYECKINCGLKEVNNAYTRKIKRVSRVLSSIIHIRFIRSGDNPMIYENLYSKTFFTDNGKKFGQGYLCIKLSKNAWGSLEVTLTDGFRDLAFHTCPDILKAIKKIKLLKESL